MFARNDFGSVEGAAGASGATLWLSQAQQALPGTGLSALLKSRKPRDGEAIDWRSRLKYWAEDVELVPDLGQNIGSLTWLRGAATCFALCFTAISLRPDFAPLPDAPEAPMNAASYDELRSQMLTPIAFGADSGRHMGPTDAVASLTQTPERPMIQLSAAIGSGDSFAHALARAGVSSTDSRAVMAMLGPDVSPGSLAPGTRLDITLGRRPNRTVSRPLDGLSFRARLDLAVNITRENQALALHRTHIAVDNTPLRIRDTISDSLYQAARAAGATPGTIQTYLRVIGQQISLGALRPGDQFDIIVAHRRAETGETETGDLLYGGLKLASGKKIDMLKWAQGGRSEWFEASGVGRVRPGLAKPVQAARLSSGFGMRFHPILGYSRLHAGVDFAASTGTPIYAVTDGRVAFAGRHGGHGNYVKLAHAGGLGTGYAHMSRIAVYAGEQVKRGQVIGYVGSTGLSTGPHLHYEVYRNCATVNPLNVKFEQQSQLAGGELKAFRARLAQLKSITNSPGSPVATAARTETQPGGNARFAPTKIAMR